MPVWSKASHRISGRLPGIASLGKSAEQRSLTQILSTILSYLGVNDLEKDSLDFGTIAIYTCEASVGRATQNTGISADTCLTVLEYTSTTI
jgi:hypothetical protein